MELINQHTKTIMEGCKARARDAGLSFQDESLEYIVTNRDLLELSPKNMIPTLYDYWVHDLEAMKERGKYELYPHNPYETVINTRPAISFYNDNNPDWLNVMIFYHVLAHIDFFQNNLYFRNTWDYDFNGEALSDKRVIARLRSEKGRWVDYVIEFARSIDNLVGYFDLLSDLNRKPELTQSQRVNYYFDYFLQSLKKVSTTQYIKNLETYNALCRENPEMGEKAFFTEIAKKYPEFDEMFRKHLQNREKGKRDILQYLMDQSPFLNNEENLWMKMVLEIVRKTSLFFQPQIRTKIMNEGWASYWHDTLFLQDDRITGHEVDYARVNARVTSLSRVGLNPYALGMRLFQFIEEQADKGKISYDFQKIGNDRNRAEYDKKTGAGRDFIFQVRENLCDFQFLHTYLDQDFVNLHQLFVAGKRLNLQRMVWEYYIKSRKASDYKEMIFNNMYHPPSILIDESQTTNGSLYLIHRFEGKPLIHEFIANTMLGIEYLWGAPVHLETHEVEPLDRPPTRDTQGTGPTEPPPLTWRKVLYTMKEKSLSKNVLAKGIHHA